MDHKQTLKALQTFIGYSEFGHLTEAHQLELANVKTVLLGTRPALLLEAFMSMHRGGIRPRKPALERVMGKEQSQPPAHRR